jgi:hypothetical protein
MEIHIEGNVFEIEKDLAQKFHIQYYESKLSVRNSFWDRQIIVDLCVLAVFVCATITSRLEYIYFLIFFCPIFLFAFWQHLDKLNQLVIDPSKTILEIRSINPVKRISERLLNKRRCYSFSNIQSIESTFEYSFYQFDRYFTVRVTLQDNSQVKMLKVRTEGFSTRIVYLLEKITGVSSRSSTSIGALRT